MAQFYRRLYLVFFVLLICHGQLLAQDCEVSVSAEGPSALCPGAGQIVLVATSGSAGATFQWQKDGVDLAGQTGNKLTVTAVGDYTVLVKGTSCEEKISTPFKVVTSTNPTADFTFTDNVCSGSNVRFTATTSGPGFKYKWDFGDPDSGSGNTGNLQEVNHTFVSNGTGTVRYQIKLTVTNAGGCTSEVTKELVINQRADPSLEDVLATQNFSLPFTNCASVASNYLLKVRNTSTTKATNRAYTIDWGDGQIQNFPASFEEAEHTYTTQGEFNLKLVIAGPNCTSTKNIKVFNGSNPSLTVGSPGNTVGCAPVTYTFPITGIANNSPSTIYTFQFDDGSPGYTFTQDNVPTSLTHTFLKSSCNNGGTDAFKLNATAKNPCGITNVIVSSIYIAAKPKASFELEPKTPTVCINTAYTLKNTSDPGANMLGVGRCNNNAGYQWEIAPATGWSLTSGTLTSQSPVINFSAKGDYNIKLKVTNNCSSHDTTFVFSVLEPPTADFTTTLNPNTGCANLEVATNNQSVGEQLTYLWSVSPDAGYTITSGSLTSKDPVFNFTTAGIYTLTLETINPCGTSKDSTQVKVNAPPTVTLPGAQELCAPGVIAFTDANTSHRPEYMANFGTISAYKWTVTGAGGATFVSGSTDASQYPSIDFPVAGTYTVTVTATNECGVSAAASQEITIRELPLPPTVAGLTICDGEPAVLTATGGAAGTTYRWYEAATGGSPVFTGDTFTPSPALTTTTTFYVDAVSGFNCVSATRTAVTVVVLKGVSNNNIAAQGAVTICEGVAPNPIIGSNPEGGDGAPYQYKWQISTDGVTFTDAPGTNTEKDYSPALITRNTWFRRTIASQKCAIDVSNVVAFTFSPTPAAPLLTLNDVAICEGQQASLSVNPQLGFTYKWYTASTGGTLVTTGESYQTPVLVRDTVFYVEALNENSCVSTSRSEVRVRVAATIADNTVMGGQDICTGQTPGILTGSQPMGGNNSFTYTWESSVTSGTSGFVPIPNSNTKDYSPAALTTTTWFRRVASSAGCVTTSGAVEVTVKPEITDNIVSSGQTVCAGKVPAAFTGSQPLGGNNTYTYQWEVSTISGTAGFAAINGATAKDFTPTEAVTQNTWFRRVVNSGTCQKSESEAVLVEVQQPIASNTISADQAICSGESIGVLMGQEPTGGSGAYTYVWEQSTTSATAGFSPIPDANAKDLASMSLTVTTWFRRVVTAGACDPSISNAVQVTVSPALENNLITNSQTQIICIGSTPAMWQGAQPTGGDNVFTFQWEQSTDGVAYTDILGATDINYAPAAPTQDTWYRRKVISRTCTSTSPAVKVEVQQPIADNSIAGEQTICAGSFAQALTGSQPTGGSGNYGYQWEASTDGNTYTPIANAAQGEYTPVNLAQTTWFRRIVTGGACAANVSNGIKVTVTAPVTNNIISAPQSICSNTAPLALTGSQPASDPGASFTYQWESSTTSATAPDFTAITGAEGMDYAPGVLTQTTWFRRVVTTGGCTSASEAIKITVEPLPASPTVANQVICENNSATLAITGASAGTYQWFDVEIGGTALGQGASFTTPVLTTSATYYVQVTDAKGCISPRAMVQVTVNQNIGNNIVSSNQALCVGSSPSLLTGTSPTGGNGVYTYLWEKSTLGPDTGFSPAPGTNSDSTYLPTNITTVTWFRRRVTAGPCLPSVSEAVRISISPVITNNRISFPQSTCSGTPPAPITGTQPQGGDGTYTYLWESSTTGTTGGFAPAAGNYQERDYQPESLTQTTWFRRTVLSGGCTITSAVVQVTVVPLIANNEITADQTICSGDAVQPLTGSTPTGGNGTYTYLWESSTDGVVFTPAAGENRKLTYTPGVVRTTTWYRRTVTSFPCFESKSTPVKITVITPIANNIIRTGQEVCANTAPGLLEGSLPTGGGPNITYRWEVSTDGATGTYTPAPGANTELNYQPSPLTQTSWFRRVVVSVSCQNQPSNVVQIKVNQLPAAPALVTSNPRVCPGDRINVTVTNPGFGVEWYDQPQGGTLLYTDVTFPTPALTETTTFYVQSLSREGCPSSSRTAVTVEVVPAKPDAGPDVSIIIGRSANLQASGGVKYEWSPATGLSSVNTAATIATPKETTTYTVTVTTAEGCIAKDEVTVTVLPEIFIPNVLTLNKDGINDEWEIQNIEKYPNCKVEVFNRWGTRLFTSEGYQTRWDGTYQGKPLPVAAYYYIIQLDKDEKPIAGSITIIN
ncbi:gliding motility-associated C-terminal domain-containing protein [Rufibacter latericius]|uniref:PKD domain-containing protein n=1 Tax=Rufibacter latericius TaxID=2487040 RepID=A0A3M9MDG3_9BACT|nr:gliding motility-associated C-terminal domain-containing protein [Rufibacter latericius]RNI23544.1 PKD domain-containing protein [Rufibacter latericius]